MRYFAKLRGQKEPVAVEIEKGQAEGAFSIAVGEVRHSVDALTLEHGAVSLIIDGQSYAVEFEESGDEVGVLVRNQVFWVDVIDERRSRLRAAGSNFSAEGKQTLCAPMPGKIVKVLVKAGDEVL